jgi:hypothetical protein
MLLTADPELSAMLVVEGVHFYNRWRMFLVIVVQAAAIRIAYEVGGDSEAVAEFRIQFPGFMDAETALLCARMIAGWQPFSHGRLGRRCSARLARQSERAKSGRQACRLECHQG